MIRIRIEDYLTGSNVKHRKALTQLHLSCHPLMIEKGRHQKPPREQFDKTYRFSKTVIEQELHYYYMS